MHVMHENESLPAGSDEELMLQLKEGDESALRLLMERYDRELHNYLRRKSPRDPSMADDAFQETFTKLYLARDIYDGRKFRAWLFTIATNALTDLHRRSQRHRRLSLDAVAEDTGLSLQKLLLSDDPEPADLLVASEEKEELIHMIQELPSLQRDVLILTDFYHLKYREVALRLHIPIGTVKSRRHTAIGSLGAIAKQKGYSAA